MDVAEQLHHAVDALAKASMMTAGPNAAAAAHIGSMGTLASLMATAMIFAKRPAWVENITKDGPNDENSTPEMLAKMSSAITTPEAIIFAALLAAHVMDSYDEAGNLATSFGPSKLWMALQDWSKIFPDRRADDFIVPQLLSAARDAGRGITSPLDSLLAGRITHKNLPDTLN